MLRPESASSKKACSHCASSIVSDEEDEFEELSEFMVESEYLESNAFDMLLGQDAKSFDLAAYRI